MPSTKTLIWIVPRNPWPPRCGASLANSELIQAMAERGYSVTLIVFCGKSFEKIKDEICTHLKVKSVHHLSQSFIWRTRVLRIFTQLFFQCFSPKTPLTVIPFTGKRARQCVEAQLDMQPGAVVVWDGLHPMGMLFRALQERWASVVQIYRAHNIETHIWEARQKSLRFPVSWLFERHVSKMRIFENLCLKRCHGVAFVNSADAEFFRKSPNAEKPHCVVPISIPMDPTERELRRVQLLRGGVCRENSDHVSLLWLGGLDWWPNREALLWFAAQVWKPLLRIRSGLTLTLVGRHTDKVKRLFPEPTSRVLGFVDSVAPYFESSNVLIAPIQSGGGIRVKALEALAHGVPCVGTPLGLSGVPSEGVFVCETAADWIQLLQRLTPKECLQKGIAGFDAIGHFHSRKRSSETMHELIQRSCRKESMSFNINFNF